MEPAQRGRPKKLSQRVYFGALDDKKPVEVIRWELAEKFGWTLEYIDSLAVANLHEYLQIQDGLAHVKDSILQRKNVNQNSQPLR